MMDASTMLMTKDDVTRPVERSAFRTVWSKVGWTEAADDAEVSPLINNKLEGLSFEGRPPITVAEHLEVEEAEAASAVVAQDSADAAAEEDESLSQAEGDAGDLDVEPKSSGRAKPRGKAAASTPAGDSTQSTSPTDQ